ncbi:branched-chain amino acid transport system II carrier protein [Psychrilyobacter atlanticus]|uniref:branched-chain amino acid transport system II carrier protein n=1 Tax=Psychrilyobacter atlanticus TaxID=271091 RepID=UPI000420527B|nr:branched-chain amino acid transport system II carrier protein [Psychrilyobacter atlanticus]
MKNKNDVLVFGLAIFAMFFGAGNLIFPPEIGLMTGKEWLAASAGFFLTGICLPVCGLLAFSRVTDINKFGNKVSNKFNTGYFTLLILSIGPMLGVPRTAATAYEMGIAPNFGDINPLLVSSIYFTVVYILVMKPSKLMNNIGKYLTPIILTILAVIILKGSFMGFGVPGNKIIDQNSFSYGFFGGYQTMDAITSVILGAIIIKGLKANGYVRETEQRTMIVKSGLLAGLGMALVYGGLLYLGAMANGNGLSLSRSELIMYFAQTTMGSLGIAALGMCVTAACLTTSIALVAIVADFFSERTKLSYRTITTITCVISAVLAATGLGFIIDIAVPILTILYPVTIILIALNILKIDNPNIFKGSIYTGLSFSILEVISKAGISDNLTGAFNLLPFSSEGFAWLLPTLLISIFTGTLLKGHTKIAVE